MPELPEVETVRADLQVLVNKQIIGATLGDAKLLPAVDAAALVERRISAVCRRGKYLWLEFDTADTVLLCHLRMTGQMIYRAHDGSGIASGHPMLVDLRQLPNKHTRLQLVFTDESEFFFQDSRRFATAELLPVTTLSDYFARFGPEPLTASWTFANFDAALGQRKTNIKAALLNQQIVFGLGNIYVDEACFAAGIRPQTPVVKLGRIRRRRLFEAIVPILEASIKNRGTSVSDFVDSNGQAGGYGELLSVYGRANEPCRNCNKPISKGKLAGRGTHWCGHCQR